jgi:threonine aldolase
MICEKLTKLMNYRRIKMYSFKNDYSEGAHPRILNALMESNLEQTDGYGEDCYTAKAVELIKEKIKVADADVHFLSGGTQTNLTTISAFLRPHEAAIAANTGHILVHETGAIEATGHKVISIEVEDGKLNASHIKGALDAHTDEHMVKPKLVYISNPTEVGSIYTKAELEEISGFCREKNLILFMDGARLGSALCSEENDLDLSDLAALTDAFYIGGTKSGALLGEALVICKASLKEDFRFHMKQKGALLAKGRVLGIQFLELFKDNLYFDLAKHANKLTVLIARELSSMGYKFLTHSPSNQIFPILPNRIIEALQEKYAFYVWSKVDDENSSIRLVTSWATKEDAVLNFIEDLRSLTL